MKTVKDAYDRIKKSKINNEYEKITNSLMNNSVENSLAMTVTPDAYVGKLVKSIPPHFSSGFCLSGALYNTNPLQEGLQTLYDEIKSSAQDKDSEIDLKANIPETIIHPAASLKLRIGGIFLPFDFGGFFMATVPGMINNIKLLQYDFSLDYLAFGFDIRYAILQGNLILPQISVGAGYAFQKQTLAIGFSNNFLYTDTLDPSVTKTGKLTTSNSFSIQTGTLYLSLQISKQLGFIIPFLGFRASLYQYNNGYSWDYTLTDENGTKFEENSKNGSGSQSRDFIFDNHYAQIFGGLTLTFPYFELALSASWNIKTFNYSGSVSLSFKM